MGTGPPGFRTKRIIAVFGGSPKQPILESAKELGRLVAAHDQILLTGGTRPVLDSVKNAAICGAGSSPWVGVDRKSPVRAENSTESKRGLVISSDLGHARNYLEACMCDAAVVLEGASGTLSELTCALSLGRPVGFVGPGWKEEYDLDDPMALDQMAQRTADKFGESSGAIKSLVDRDVLRSGLSRLPPYRYFDLGAEAKVIDWIKSVVPDGERFPGSLPKIQGYESVAARYNEWLAEHTV